MTRVWWGVQSQMLHRVETTTCMSWPRPATTTLVMERRRQGRRGSLAPTLRLRLRTRIKQPSMLAIRRVSCFAHLRPCTVTAPWLCFKMDQLLDTDGVRGVVYGWTIQNPSRPSGPSNQKCQCWKMCLALAAGGLCDASRTQLPVILHWADLDCTQFLDIVCGWLVHYCHCPGKVRRGTCASAADHWCDR